MFTGIIEQTGSVAEVANEGSNMTLTINAEFAPELKVDQSVAHNGVCLTVTSVDAVQKKYTVTAIDETLQKTNLKFLKAGDKINLERGMLMTTRLDGHIVQGHVDARAVCTKIENKNGSHLFTFETGATTQSRSTSNALIVEKGSVTVNGVSLTVVEAKDNLFSVAIIPYTFLHTTFNFLKTGDVVNVEFDIIGKYVARLLKMHHT